VKGSRTHRSAGRALVDCDYAGDLAERIFRGLYPGLRFTRSSSGELYGVMLETTLLASDTLGGLAELIDALGAHHGPSRA
jgi:hypothetical protein